MHWSLTSTQALTVVSQHSDISKTDAIAAEVHKFELQLRAAEKEAQQYNSREGLIGKPLTDYSSLKALLESFEPYHQFWSTTAEWKVRTCTELDSDSLVIP
jgi:dynein heavy chain